MSGVENEKVTFENVKFGDVSVDPSALITFPSGLPGFERFKQFAMIALEEERPFVRLLCTEESRLGFVLVDPMPLWPDYDPNIADDDLEGLELEQTEDLAIYCLVTLGDTPEQVSANLKGPICINMSAMKATQMILVDERYSTKHPLVDTQQVNE